MEVLEAGPGGRPSRHRALLITLLAVVLAVVTVVLVVPRRADPPVPATREAPSPSAPPTAPPTLSDAPETWSTEPFLDDLDLVVFARSADSVFRIDTRTHEVTATRTPRAPGWVSFVAGRTAAIGQEWFADESDSAGFLVADGRRSEPLPAALRAARQILPASDGGLWVSTSREGRGEVRRTDFAGRTVAGTVAIPLRNWPMILPDGRGGIWRPGTRSSFALTAAGEQPIPGGPVVAVGTNHVITLACRPNKWCRHRLLSRRDGSSSLLPAARDLPTDGYLAGRISPDGRFAAGYTDDDAPQLTVVDLRTGTTILRFRSAIDLGDPASLIWLPDNRLLWLRDGRVNLFDPILRRGVPADLKLPRLLQLTIRG